VTIRNWRKPAWLAHREGSGNELQGAEERDEVRLLLLGELDVEPRVVEVDDRVEVGGEAVVELRKGRSKTQVLSTHCNPFKCFRATESR
jgi:hypothetical protein